jgi:hypothetical protein
VLTYVDDIIVKSRKQENHITDLQETFANFRQAGLKLNPEKCVCWGPSASEGPQKQDLTVFLEYNV